MFEQQFEKLGFTRNDRLWCQPGFENEFQHIYIANRKSERRWYTDEEALLLPYFKVRHKDEWSIRQKSFDRLLKHLLRKRPRTILEIGCGNGWLLRRLSEQVGSICCGMDVNKDELLQAARLYSSPQLSFVWGNIMDDLFNDLQVDVVLLASSLQYFKELSFTINRFKTLLSQGGEIHIIDTPFYTDDEADGAHNRSSQYFDKQGNPSMKNHYFHHRWRELEKFSYRMVYNPGAWIHRLKSTMVKDSPFPWIIIGDE
ncbi:MAG: class I SAM-dependent methyltransferase [Bacteroidetes bacterium]|nr:class I SAM-dependent methyltransferase [Bacteroidota bacterium]